MSGFYAQLAETASRLLTDKGQSVAFSREITSNFVPATGVKTSSTSAFSGYGAAFDYNSSEIDGEVIRRSDIRLLLEPISTAPIVGDQCTVDSKAYRVLAVDTLSPGGTVCRYELQLRV